MSENPTESSSTHQRRSQRVRVPNQNSDFVYATNFTQGIQNRVIFVSEETNEATRRPRKRKEPSSLEQRRQNARERKRASRIRRAQSESLAIENNENMLALEESEVGENS
ncbi:hypothetical protein A0J61_11050, partial [Choanephora cucurbitarum]